MSESADHEMNAITPESQIAPENVSPASVEPPIIPWGWVRALTAIPIWIIVQVIIMIPVTRALGLGGEIEDDVAVNTPAGIILQLALLAATLLTVWPLCRWIDRRSLKSLGLEFNGEYARALAGGVLGGIALISAVFLVIFGLGGLTVVAIHPPSVTFLILTVTMILVAVNEELFVRGYLLNSLMTSTNKYVALVLSSLIFAFFHLFNPNVSPVGMANLVLAGLLLGIYYVHRRNLWFPIGLHFTWNLFQGGVYGSKVSGAEITGLLETNISGHPLLTGGAFGFEASLVTSAFLLIAIAVVHRLYRPRRSSSGLA